MENKLAYYNLGLIDPEFLLALWEYPKAIPLRSPTIFSYIPNKTAFKISGYRDFNEIIKTEELPPDVVKIRIRNNVKASFIVDPNLTAFQFHYPILKGYEHVQDDIQSIIGKVLIPYGLTIKQSGNDIFFTKDGFEKKFFGMMGSFMADGWKVVLFSLTFEFNSFLANRIYRLDNEKFTRKGVVTDLGQIVGGLREVVPDIDRDKLISEIVNEIAIRYALRLESSILSEEDLRKMNFLKDKLII